MRILLINPNTSADMTERIAAQARRHCDPASEIVAVTASFGCEVVASRASYAIAAHAALDAFARHAKGIDAVILACFGDPGLEALREIAAVPVVGLLECAAQAVQRQDGPFGIVTAGSGWVPMLRERILLTGQSAAFRGVFAIEGTGLSVSRAPALFVDLLQAAVDRAVAAGVRTVILGGSSMAGMGSALDGTVDLIDPVETAVEVALQQGAGLARAPCTARPAIASSGLGRDLESLLGA